jgi:TonB-linked SusC/RagA family outer membrane protein
MSNKVKKIRPIHFSLRSVVFFGILLLTSLAFPAMAAKLTGRITDEKGELLVGVNIIEKGTSNGGITDINGTYNIELKGKQPIIVVTYLGYNKQEIKIGNQGILDIVLIELQSALNEVVVVGYGEQRKISVIGAQSQLNIANLKVPAGNLGSSIAGRMAGVVAVQRSGEPGHDESDIWIRGISTFADQNSKPLVLVDGVERSFSNIDPEDIESFTVLKDASATAVYGVRGANGVIIIKTKPGKVGKPTFSFDYYEGVTRLTKSVDMADGYQYMDAANDAYKNSKNGLVLYKPQYIEATKKANGLLPNDNPLLYNKYLYPNVDWMKEIFKDWGRNRRANMNVRGGSPNASYYVSVSYYNEEGLTKTDQLAQYNADMSFSRYNFTTNLNLKATDKTFIDIGVQGYVSEGNYPSISTSDAFAQAMWVTPVDFPVGYPGGQIPGINPNGDGRNPYADITRRGYKNEYKTQINSNLRVTQDLDYWDWSKGLKVFAMYAFDTYNTRFIQNTKRENTYFPTAKKDPDTGLWINDPTAPIYDAEGNFVFGTPTYTGSSTLAYSKGLGGNRATYLEAGMNYDRVFNGIHRVSGLILYNQRIFQSSDKDDQISALPNKNRGIAARATYSLKDRYFAEFNLGSNGSENFAPAHRYGVFPAFGLGYAISSEPFWTPLKRIISFLKVRYTDGKVGSDVITDRRFGYLTIVQAGQSGYSFANSSLGGIAITDYGTDVVWSTSRKQDLGIDLKFFDDRLTITTDLFKERRSGIFLRRAAVPALVGLTSMPWGNLGIVDNNGIEISVEYMQKLSKDMFLTVRGNFTRNVDKIVENDQPAQVYPWMDQRGTNVLASWGYVAQGLFTSKEDIANHAYQGSSIQVGDIKYKDLNGDNKIDSYDIQKIGHGDVPQIVYGFGADFQWGNFSIGALLQGTYGADRLLNGKSIMPFSGDGGVGNLYSNITDRADKYIVTDAAGNNTLTNQNVFYPRLAWGGGEASNVNNFKASTWWLKDISFLRLKQLSIAYQLPKKWMQSVSLVSGSVYIMGNNLYTWSSFKLWDPELNTSNGTSYPNASATSLGLSFKF